MKETLERQGTLNQVKARIRAEVFNALDDQTESRPPLTSENLLIIELVREFLDFNGYKYTSSVMQAGLNYLIMYMLEKKALHSHIVALG